jgi:hypothetical protein
MSVLDDFARMGLYRKKAAEFQCLADNASAPGTRRRFRTIARHYSELADREEQADKARMAEVPALLLPYALALTAQGPRKITFGVSQSCDAIRIFPVRFTRHSNRGALRRPQFL